MEKTGWFCSYTPVEIIDAAGTLPAGIKYDSGAEHEDVLLGDSMCSYVRSCMGGALTNKYDDLSGVVIAHSCECMRRLSDGWEFRQHEIKPELIHILDIPKVVSDSSIKFFAGGIKRMKEDLENKYGEISEDAIRKSIEKYNKIRETFKKIDDLRKKEDTAVTGTEIEQLMSEYFSTDPENFSKKAYEFYESKKDASQPNNLPRVMIIGGPGNSSLIKTIENSGGLSVVENMCTGIRAFADESDPDSDPYKELAKMYLEKTPCPRMLGDKAREGIDEISSLAEEYNVDGILYFSMKFCANMQMQWALLKNNNSSKIPIKVIEGDISSEINEREIHSFIKRLKKRRKKNQ